MISCILNGVYKSVKKGVIISGHSFVLSYKDKKEEWLECEKCGYISVGRFHK